MKVAFNKGLASQIIVVGRAVPQDKMTPEDPTTTATAMTLT